MTARQKILVAIAVAVATVVGLSIGLGFLGEGEAIDRSSDPDPEGAFPFEGRPESGADPTLVGRAPPPAEPEPLPAPVDLDACDRARDVFGVVVRADGSPVAGADVVVLRYPWRYQDLLASGGYDEVVEGPATRTARDGTFRLRLDAGAQATLRVAAEGLAPTEVGLVQAGERLRIVLRDAVRLVVRTKDEAGHPVAGAALRLFPRGGAGPTLSGSTDAAGTAVFPGLEPSRSLWVEALHPTLGSPGWTAVLLPGAGEASLEIVLPPGRTLRGRVTDARTGTAIAGARVGMNWTLRPAVSTDAEGRYALAGWTGTGVHDVHVLAQGYGRAQAEVRERDEIDFALLPGDLLVGRVLGPDRGGVPGARVAAIGFERRGAGSASEQVISPAHGRTDESGRFRLTDLRHDMPHTLVVVAEGCGRLLLDVDPAPDPGGTIDVGDVVLAPGLAIAGRVVDADGAPVAGVPLTCRGWNVDRSRLRPDGPAQRYYARDLERRTDDLGRFLFPDLSPGTWTLRVTPAGGPPASLEVALADGDRRDLVVSLDATRTLRVRVVDDSGAPIAGADVTAAAGERPARERTDAAGEVVLQVPREPVRVSVWLGSAPGVGAPEEREVAVGTTEVTIVARRARLVTGTLLDPDGGPWAGQFVLAYRGGPAVAYSFTDPEGRFSLAVTEDGPVDVVFDIDAAEQRARASTPALGVLGRVDGVLPGTGGVVLATRRVATDRTLAVRVLDPDGRPVPGAQVHVVESALSGPWGEPRGTDAEGWAMFAGLRALSCEVRLFPFADGSKWAVLRPRRVVPDGQEVVVRLRPGVLLTVRVVADGGPPRLTVLRLRDADGSEVATFVAREDGVGRVRLDPDDAGPFALEAETWVGERITARREGVRPTDGEVEIRFPPGPER